MHILKLICLYICLAGILDISAMEQPPKKPRSEERAAPSQITFESLPPEIQLHIAQSINAPTLKDAIQKIKAYLLTSKKTAVFLYDEQFTRSLLLELQKRFHRSMLEIANLMKSVASKKIAEDLRREAEKSWKEYLLNKEDMNYAMFIFKNKQELDSIPSLLYYVYSNPTYSERASMPFPENLVWDSLSSDKDPLANLKLWIDSGLLNHTYPLQNLWRNILLQPRSNAAVDIAKLVIDAGYNVNIIINAVGLTYIGQNIPQLPQTLLDSAIYEANHWIDLAGTREHSAISNYHKIIRMLIKAGAKSSYELQNP